MSLHIMYMSDNAPDLLLTPNLVHNTPIAEEVYLSDSHHLKITSKILIQRSLHTKDMVIIPILIYTLGWKKGEYRLSSGVCIPAPKTPHQFNDILRIH